MTDKKLDAYDYVPATIAPSIPMLYATEKDKDPTAWIKLFTPDSSWTWFVTEYDPAERLCFGLVIGLEKELGYFSLEEIETIRGRMGLPVERDLYWEPKPLSQCE